MKASPNKNNRICAIIPFYNEKIFIREIISSTSAFVEKIILIDDGSTDGTSELVEVKDNIALLKHKENLGKGIALNTGFREAIKLGFDLAITIDADLQHNPTRIPDFIQAARHFEIVTGNRLNDLSGMPLARRFSNFTTSFLLSLKCRQKIQDSQCGFRCYRVNILEEILPESSGFEAESEILIKASRKGYKIGSVEIPTIYGNEKSKMKNLKAIKGFLKVLLTK